MTIVSNADREKWLRELCPGAYTSLGFLFLLTLATLYTISKKKTIVYARGNVLYFLIFGAHFISIFVPNMITIFSSSNNTLAVCMPKYIYMLMIQGISAGLSSLILFRSIFLYAKSKGENIKHMRMIFGSACVILVLLISFITSMDDGYTTRSEYYFLNFCNSPYLNLYRFNNNDFIFLLVFLFSLWIMNYFRIWGIREEMRWVCVLQLVYMATKGFHKKFNSKCYLTGEIIENAYRVIFMFFNCVLFLWVYDDKSGLHRPVENMNIYSLDRWNEMVLASFMMFLRVQKYDGSYYFMRDKLLKADKYWEFLNFKDSNIIFYKIKF